MGSAKKKKARKTQERERKATVKKRLQQNVAYLQALYGVILYIYVARDAGLKSVEGLINMSEKVYYVCDKCRVEIPSPIRA